MEKQIVLPEDCLLSLPEGYCLASPGDTYNYGDLYFEDDGDKKWHVLTIMEPERYDPEIHYPRALKIKTAETTDELLGAIKAIHNWLTDNNCPNHYKILRAMRIAERYVPRKER